MPIFKVGNFSQIGVSFAPTAKVVKVEHKENIRFPRKLTLDAVGEASFNIEPPQMALAKSPNKWGLYLKSLSLYESFEGFIANLFNPANQIYFAAIAWDYSGNKPFIYPPKGAKASDFLIPMKAKTCRQFVGNGVNLWPAQIVTGALNLVILVYESDKDTRDLGDQLAVIHEIVANSKLASLVTDISASPSVAGSVAICTAVNELVGVIGNIMKRNKDDYVDLFEGSYGTDKTQKTRVEKCDHESAGIELELTVS